MTLQVQLSALWGDDLDWYLCTSSWLWWPSSWCISCARWEIGNSVRKGGQRAAREGNGSNGKSTSSKCTTSRGNSFRKEMEMLRFEWSFLRYCLVDKPSSHLPLEHTMPFLEHHLKFPYTNVPNTTSSSLRKWEERQSKISAAPIDNRTNEKVG